MTLINGKCLGGTVLLKGLGKNIDHNNGKNLSYLGGWYNAMCNIRKVKKELRKMGFVKKRSQNHYIYEGCVDGKRKCIPISFSPNVHPGLVYGLRKQLNDNSFMKGMV